jgi:hypothetical protein
MVAAQACVPPERGTSLQRLDRDHSGIAELTWTAGRAEGCVAPATITALRQSCASFEVGTVRGRGFVRWTRMTRRWCGSPGLPGRGAWGSATCCASSSGPALFPLRRYRFYFGPDETAHQVPAFGVTGALGIAVILP